MQRSATAVVSVVYLFVTRIYCDKTAKEMITRLDAKAAQCLVSLDGSSTTKFDAVPGVEGSQWVGCKLQYFDFGAISTKQCQMLG